MKTRFVFRLTCALALLCVGLLAPQAAARADGGMVLPDPNLWALIDEGQQIAVVSLGQENTAQVDLFITLNDRSGTSHQVTFFVPLGQKASNFTVVEEKELVFDKKMTAGLDEELDQYIRREASYKTTIRNQLFLGTLMTNGLWSLLALTPLIASGCGAAQAPVATYKTENSTISIYEMNAETNLEDLIATTGLDPSVSATLESLRGQQIAVVQLQTQPPSQSQDDWETYEQRSQGQPGIHLGWQTTLMAQGETATYAYPLSTGKAWASPIELTRVYIVAEKGIDFSVQSPQLGADLSGVAGESRWSSLTGQIYYKIDRASSPAFASDNAYGSYGRIWRGTYIKSKSDQDIVITRLARPGAETQVAVRTGQFHAVATSVTGIIALLCGALAWLVSWWLVMNKMLGMGYRLREGRLYGDAFTWALAYPLTLVAALLITGLVGGGLGVLFIMLANAFTGSFSDFGLVVAAFLVGTPLLIAVIGLVNAYLFARGKAKQGNISRPRAFGAYMLTVLSANGIYLVFSLIYAAIVGGF